MFWISLSSDRGSGELLETDFEQFVAPNAVLCSPLSLSQWEHDWLATKDANHTPPPLPPSGLRPDGGRKKGKGVVGSHSVIAPLAQGQMVAEQVAWGTQLSLWFGHCCDQFNAPKQNRVLAHDVNRC